MKPKILLDELNRTFSDSRLFGPQFVNDPTYLKMYRAHARVCGLLARVGTELGFIAEFGRRYPIDHMPGRGRRKHNQRQAEADVSFVEPSGDSGKPIALFDYETSDAPIFKMRRKFDYLSTFAKHTPSVQIMGLLITVTGIINRWKCPETKKCETLEERQEFAKRDILELICALQRVSHNSSVLFLLGIFSTKHLHVCIYKNGEPAHEKIMPYGIQS